MTDYDFRQHIGEWVDTRSGGFITPSETNSD